MTTHHLSTMIKALMIAAVLVLGQALPAAAAETTETFTLTRADLENSNAALLGLTLAIGGANVTVMQSDNSDIILRAGITYDTRGPKPELRTTTAGTTFSATLSSGYESYYRIREFPYVQTWSVVIGSYSVDTDLTVAGGGVEATMDFGGMPVRNINLALGGVQAQVDFSTPLSRRLETFMVEGGGINLSIDNMGNTDFKRFQLTGGGILGVVNFRGAYGSPDHSIMVVNAGGTLVMSVPEAAGATVDALAVGALVLPTGSGWQTLGNFFFFLNYQTGNYATADVRLDMEVIAVGTVVTLAHN